MRGSDIALATLMRENPQAPCINFCWMTNSAYMSRLTGRNYWANRETAFFEYLRQAGINLVPQWYFPGDGQRRLEDGRMMHEHLAGGTEAVCNPGEIRAIVEQLLGVAGLQGFEEEHGVSYDAIVKLKDRRDRPIGVWGCVSVTSTLPHGTVEDVKRSVERSFTAAGKDRGFVLSSTSSIMPEVPHANIDVLFKHGKQFGREFLST